MSRARRIQIRHRATDPINQVLPGNWKSRNQMWQIWGGWHGMPKREQQNASSSSARNESHLSQCTSLDRPIAVDIERDEDVINMSSPCAELGDVGRR